jgi:hypothetical protein
MSLERRGGKYENTRKALALAAALVISFANIAALRSRHSIAQGSTAWTNAVLRVPTWTKTQLANGATLIVSERHNCRSCRFTITFVGGSNQFEPAGSAVSRR